MSTPLATVWRAARARAVPFAAESAAFIVLLACEELCHSPRRVRLDSISLELDGSVRVLGSEPSDELRTQQDLRALLSELLEVASSPGPALMRSAGRSATGNLRGFGSELEKALIPMNRAAARRALSRVHRETERAEAAGLLAAESPALGRVPEPEPEPEHAPAPPSLRAEVVEPTPRPLAFAREAEAAGWQFHAPVDQPTRPETVAARRRFGGSSSAADPAGSALTPVGGAVASRMFRAEPEPPCAPVDEENTERISFLPEPTVHSAALPAVAPKIEATPAVTPISAVVEVAAARANAPSELEGWPVELASEAAAIPLELEWSHAEVQSERARPGRLPVAPPRPERRLAATDPSDEVELMLESPLGLSSLPLAVRARDDDAEPPDHDKTPEWAPTAYTGMTVQQSDVQSLLSRFRVGDATAEGELRQELKRLAGVEGTPSPNTQLRRR